MSCTERPSSATSSRPPLANASASGGSPAAIRRAAAALRRSRRDSDCATNHATTAISATVTTPATSNALSSADCNASRSGYGADTDNVLPSPTPVAAQTRGSPPPLMYVPACPAAAVCTNGVGNAESSSCAPSASVPSR